MQVLLIILVVLAVILAVFLAARAHMSRSKTVPETPSDSLAPCPITPNCVCSETGTASSHAVEPLRLRVESGEQVIPRLIDLVEDLAVDTVIDDRIVFSLKVRGDQDRLMRSIALQRVLEPIDAPVIADDPFGLSPVSQSLHYQLIIGS